MLTTNSTLCKFLRTATTVHHYICNAISKNKDELLSAAILREFKDQTMYGPVQSLILFSIEGINKDVAKVRTIVKWLNIEVCKHVLLRYVLC